MDDKPERREQEVFSITSASVSQSEELGGREKRYAISMAIRTLCFVGAIIAHDWLRWVLLAGALILPYTSVILANAGVRKKGSGPSPFGEEEKPALPAGADLNADSETEDSTPQDDGPEDTAHADPTVNREPTNEETGERHTADG